MAVLFRDLEVLLRNCGPKASKHDQVKVLTHACIDEGIDNGPWIISMVSSMGFNPRHVGKLLRDSIGHLWTLDKERRYTNLPTLN